MHDLTRDARREIELQIGNPEKGKDFARAHIGFFENSDGVSGLFTIVAANRDALIRAVLFVVNRNVEDELSVVKEKLFAQLGEAIHEVKIG